MKSLHILSIAALVTLVAACDGNDKSRETTSGATATEETTTATPTISEPEVAMPKVEDGVQIVRVVVNDMGYTPDRIQFTPGIPARIIFEQHGKHECSSQVQAPDLGIKVTDVPQGEETVVEFTPEKEGEYTFTCGMEMLKGKIIVRKS